VEQPTPEQVEIDRRSVAMLAPRQWALRREEALHVYAQLIEALLSARRTGGGTDGDADTNRAASARMPTPEGRRPPTR